MYDSLSWRHDECHGASNHRRFDCLRNRLFRRRSEKTSKIRVTGLCEGNSSVTGEFPAQRASNAENVSIRRHHVSDQSCEYKNPLIRFRSNFADRQARQIQKWINVGDNIYMTYMLGSSFNADSNPSLLCYCWKYSYQDMVFGRIMPCLSV